MIEVELPDGRIVEFPAGTDRNTINSVVRSLVGVSDRRQAMRDRVEAARAGTLEVSPENAQRAAAADQIAMDRATIASEGPFVAGVTKAMQGVPFVGEFYDEATGALAGAMGRDGDAARDRVRNVQAAMDRENPILSTGLMVGGGVAGGLAAGGLLARGAQALGAGNALAGVIPAGIAGRIGLGAAAGATAGGIEGAVSGYGAGDGETRGEEAARRGIIGAGFGGAVGALAPVFASGIRAVAERLKGRDISVIAREFGINNDAARVVKAAIENDDMTAAQAALRRAGSDAMLADASPATAQLLDTAMQSGGAAARIGREAVETRAGAAGARINDTLDRVLGPADGVRAASRDISQRTAALRQTAYDRAYGTAIDYASAQGQRIEDVVSRVPPRTLQAAIQEANDAMRAAGVRNMQIMAEIAPDGSVVFREMPNVQQLDELKKALGAVAQSETDAVTGRISGAGIRARRLAGELAEAIGEAVPQYRTAVRLGGDKIAEQTAFDLGRNLLRSSTTRETVTETMTNASREAQEAARRGLRSYIDETLAQVQRTITDPNVDAREAMTLVKSLSSRANREKVVAAIGQGRADALFRTLDEATAQLELRSAVARNSATASRLAGREAIDQITEPGPLATLLEGRPGEAARRIVQLFTGQGGEIRAAQKQAIYADIARALTGIQGQQAQDALDIVQRAIAGQPIKSEEAARIARALTATGALAAYQTGTRSLSTP
jgi:hypothetical protein